jgi:hypothetical protein
MWQDELNAQDHYDDLVKVRSRIEAEPVQDFYNADECKKYRLDVIDDLLKRTEFELKPRESQEHFK